MCKPYGFRLSNQTSPDQYVDACWRPLHRRSPSSAGWPKHRNPWSGRRTGRCPNWSYPIGPPAVSEAEKIRALPLSIVFNALSSSVFGVWTVFG